MIRNSFKLAAVLLSGMLVACNHNIDNGTADITQGQAVNTNHKTSQHLESMHWHMQSLQSQGKTPSSQLKSGIAASKIQLVFKQNRIAIKGGCNHLGASLTITPPDGFKTGPWMSTEMACSDRRLMQTDAEMTAYLSNAVRYEIQGNNLTITTKNYETLRFQGTATAETKYGSKGIRKFIEINNSSAGLKWREAQYDKNWIRIKDNASWQDNFPGIEGFTPEMDHEYIVRIHEFVDTSTQSPVWVKDMVTMQGILNQ